MKQTFQKLIFGTGIFLAPMTIACAKDGLTTKSDANLGSISAPSKNGGKPLKVDQPQSAIPLPKGKTPGFLNKGAPFAADKDALRPKTWGHMAKDPSQDRYDGGAGRAPASNPYRDWRSGGR